MIKKLLMNFATAVIKEALISTTLILVTDNVQNVIVVNLLGSSLLRIKEKA